MADPIVPVYMKTDPTTGEPLFGLSFRDFTRVEQGYGCPHCLEPFDSARHGACPACKRLMRENAVAALPPEWAY